MSQVFLHFFQTLDLPHFPFFNAFLQYLELFWSSQGSSMSHKLQVFLQFFLHNLDFAHFFALHFLLHFFEGQMSSQVAENVKNLSFGINFFKFSNQINFTSITQKLFYLIQWYDIYVIYKRNLCDIYGKFLRSCIFC